MRRTVEFLESLAVIEGGVVLAGHELDVLHLELADDGFDFIHPLAADFAVLGRMGEIAREDDEIRRLLQSIDRNDRFPERAGRVGVLGRSFETPMRVRELDEVEVACVGGCAPREAGTAGYEHDAAKPGELQEFASIAGMRHENSFAKSVE